MNDGEGGEGREHGGESRGEEFREMMNRMRGWVCEELRKGRKL